MALKQNEQAVVNLVINGQQAQTSLREVTGAYNALRAEISRMRREDDPAAYDQRIRQLERLRQAQVAMRNEIFKTGQETESLGTKFGKMMTVAGGNMLANALQTGLSYLKEFVGTSEEGYIESIKNQAQLAQAIKSTGGVAGMTKGALNDLAMEIRNTTGVDDEFIGKGESMLLTFTNVRGKIYEQAIPAIVDYAAAMNQGEVTMEGMQNASMQVGKALNDPIKGVAALAKVGVTFTEQQKEQIKTLVESNKVMDAQAIVLRELQKEFGGVAKAVGDTDEGKMKKFQLRIDDIQDRIGKLITTFKAGATEAFDPFLKWIEDLIAIDYAGELREEQAGVNGLVSAIVSCNDNQEVRNALVAELQAKYPDFLGNIKAEDVANALLVERLALVNDQYKERISLAVNQGSITEAQERYNKAIKDQVEARKILADVSGKSVAQLSGLSTNDLIGLSNSIVNKNRKAALDGDEDAQVRYLHAAFAGRELRRTTLDMTASLKEIGQLQGQNKRIEAEFTKDQLANVDKRLGALNKELAAEKDLAKQKELRVRIKMLEATRKEITGETAEVVAPKTGPSAEELKKQRAEQDKKKKLLADYVQHLKDAQVEVNKFLEDSTKGTEAGLDAQLKVIDDKYQVLIDRLKKLLGDEHTEKGGATYQKLMANIAGLGKQRDKEKAETSASFSYDSFEKTINDDAADQLNTARQQLADQLITEEQFADQEMAIEQKRLVDMYDIRTLFGMKTLDLEEKINDSRIRNDKKTTDRYMAQVRERVKSDQEYQAIQRQLQAERSQLADTGVQLLSMALGKTKGIMLAQIALEKALAIGRIIAAEGVEIAGYFASTALLGPWGWGAAIPMVAAAKVRASLSIANIVATGVLQAASVATSDSNKPKAAKGGYFDGPSHSDGGLDVVDTRTGKTVVNVEGDEPWMVLSKETRRNNGALINQLLFNSMYRNGAAVDVSAIDRGQAYSRFGIGGLVTPSAQPVMDDAPVQAPAGMTIEQLVAVFGPMFAKIDNMADVIDRKEFGINWHLLKKTEDKMARTDLEANA